MGSCCQLCVSSTVPPPTDSGGCAYVCFGIRAQAASKGGELLSRDQIVKNRKKEAKLRANTIPQKRKKGQPRKMGGGGNSSKAYSKGKGLGGAGKKHKR